MPDNNALDIGLNLICKKYNLIVPGMLRCNFGSNKVNLQNALYFLEISQEGVDLIHKYIEQFRQILTLAKEGMGKYLDGQRVFGDGWE